MRRDRDLGQISLLTLGYFGILLVLVLGVTELTAVHLARHRLMELADQASLAAASGLDQERYYREGLAPAQAMGAGSRATELPLGDSWVRKRTQESLDAGRGDSGFGRVEVAEPTGSPDGRTAVVTLRVHLRLPFLGRLLSLVDPTLRVTSRARSGG